MVYNSDSFYPPFFDAEAAKNLKGCYSAHMAAAKGVIVYQCSKCGKVKLSNGVLEKL